jgi:hypothetical protein
MMACDNTCSRCAKTEDGIGWWAEAYRRREISKGRADPGNLCGSCSGSEDGTRFGVALAEELKR